MRVRRCHFILVILVQGLLACKNDHTNSKVKLTQKYPLSIESKINTLISQMTLEEKIGQMNQYSGFGDQTGPESPNADANLKLEYLRLGYVGAMLNVRGGEAVRKFQKIGIP